MKTQREQIQEATAAYIMPLNNPGDAIKTHRYAVYLLRGGQLEILWPSDSNAGRDSKEIIPGQVYSTRQQYPAFHFALSGCGYSKEYEIRCELERINESINVFTLTGYTPGSAS